MTIVNAIGSVLHAIINGIVSFFGIIVGCLTCGRAGGGGGRRKKTTTSHV